MAHWNYIVIFTGCLLVVLLVAMELRRASRKWLLARIAATVVAVASLVAMALPVKMKTKASALENVSIVLTDRFNDDTVAALRKQYGSGTRVYAADSTTWAKGRKYGAVWMPYPASWAQQQGCVHIVGTGITDAALNDLPEATPVIFHFAEAPAGITQINWNEQVVSGAPLHIQGTYSGIGTFPVKLLLYGLNAPFDSVLLSRANTQTFDLQTQPKHSGSAVYRLIALNGNDTLENESIPVIVTPTDTLNVLLLAGMPDAENRFLKDWLGAQGNKVAMRTTISKAKYDQSFVNRSSATLELNASNLAAYDLIIADAEALQSLPANTLSAIATQVEKGMGLVVRTDSSTTGHAFFQQHISLQPGPTVQQAPITLQTEEQHIFPLTGAQSLWIRPAAGLRPLLQDAASHIYAAESMYGSGRIVTTTLSNTYSWQLSSQPTDYATVWNTLLQKALREKPVPYRWHTQPGFPLPDEAVHIVMESATAPSSQGSIEQTPASTQAMQTSASAQATGQSTSPQTIVQAPAFAQQAYLPFFWQATTWPEHPGWQYTETGRGSPASWYVYTPSDWLTLRRYAHLQASKNWQRAHNDILTGTSKRNAQDSEKSVPPTWFFLLFLGSAAFLWVVRKL